MICRDEGIDTMNAVTVKDASRDLNGLIETVIDNADPTIVIAESGHQAIVVPLDEYNSWKETLYLLSNPANAARLRASIASIRAGKVKRRKLIKP